MIPAMKEYRVSQTYGKQVNPVTTQITFHTGIDLVKPSYSLIYAFATGEVVYAAYGQSGSGVGGFGNSVILRDKYNHLHLYAHLTDFRVRVGELVAAGTAIGREGRTGKATGQHLHYEVRKNGAAYGYGNHIDPVSYMDYYFTKELKSPANACGISYNGAALSLPGGIVDSKAYLPVRAVAEATGKGNLVQWNDATKLAAIDRTALLTTFLLEAKAYAWSRELAAALDTEIEWDSANKIVKLASMLSP